MCFKTMENIDKINIIEQSCKKLLKNEATELNRKIDYEIEKQIKDEIIEYQEKEEFNYNKKMEKMEKDYNKQVYSLEMDSKREILNQKKLIQKDLKKDVMQIMKNFVNSNEYETFLMSKIEEVIEKIPDTKNAILSITKNDKNKFGKIILEKFHIRIEEIEDSYIGGCILEDSSEGIFIDNTIKNSIDERLEI